MARDISKRSKRSGFISMNTDTVKRRGSKRSDSKDLISKYRPVKFEEVIGQKPIVNSLIEDLESGSLSHCILFEGFTGTGKTTLARILAKELGCSRKYLIEIDAATYSGVDKIRDLTRRANFKPITGDSKVFIIDGCHGLSKQAWDALLKPLEEQPFFVYFILCTTEIGKVPKTIKSRCAIYSLKLVNDEELITLLETVLEKEDCDVSDEIIDLIVENSEGSPRQSLSLLAVCRRAGNLEEAAELLNVADIANKEIVDLARYILGRGSNMRGALDIIKELKVSQTAESIKIVLVNYFTSVFINSKGKNGRAYNGIMAFSVEYNPEEKYAPLILSLGELFGE